MNSRQRYTKQSLFPERTVHIETIPINLIQIDPVYQRPLDTKFVCELVENWDPLAVGIIGVSMRDDMRAYCFDGQHRFQAAKLKGEQYLLAEAHYHLTSAEEAQLFLKKNPGHAPNHSDYHRAALHGGDDLARRINTILTKHQLQVWYTREGLTRSNGHYIHCLATLRNLLTWLDDEIVDLAIAASVGAWPKGNDGRQARILRGLCHFIAIYHQDHHFSLDKLIGILKRVECLPYRLIVTADEYDHTYGRRGMGIAMSLAQFWNTHYPTQKLSLDKVQTLQAYINEHTRERDMEPKLKPHLSLVG